MKLSKPVQPIQPIRVFLLALALACAVPLAARADLPLPDSGGPGSPGYSDVYGFAAKQKGLSFGIPSGGGATLGFSYLLTSSAALEVSFGLNLPFTSASNTTFSIELGYRNYFARFGNRLYPFFQPGFFFNRVGGAENIALEAGIGVEYFLLEHFSIAGATGVAFTIGSIGNGSVTVGLNTGTTALYADFYI
jgi:hypothetical protein